MSYYNLVMANCVESHAGRGFSKMADFTDEPWTTPLPLDLRDCKSRMERMKVSEAAFLNWKLGGQPDYIVEPWGQTVALPPMFRKYVKIYQQNFPSQQDRTGRPFRARFLPDMAVTDLREKLVFAIDIKVSGHTHDWPSLYEVLAQPNLPDDLRDEVDKKWGKEIPRDHIELDSLYTMELLELDFKLPCFILFYFPANGYLHTATRYYLLGCRAHDAWRTARGRGLADIRAKSEVEAGSGTDYVDIPVNDLYPWERFDELFFRGVSR